MLRTNSKKAKANIRAYIMTDSDYIAERLEKDTITEAEALQAVRDIFNDEYGGVMRGKRMSEQEAFTEWAQGLALGGLFLYYYNVSAVQVLGDILEETEAERSKYTEEQAESLLTYLILKEICFQL